MIEQRSAYPFEEAQSKEPREVLKVEVMEAPSESEASEVRSLQVQFLLGR